jgi:uncharacterized protein (DUF433 family)
MDIYTTPLLTARDAAAHLRMPESTLDAWLSESKYGEPLVHSVAPERRGWPRMPFVGIVEAHVLRALRDLGMSKHQIRGAVHMVREEFSDPYALASRRIATDGVDLFVRLANEDLVSTNQQRPIREVVDSYLQYIEWDDAGKPGRLRLSEYPQEAAVIMDPHFAWGRPVLESTKTPVAAVVDLWHAGEPMDAVAYEFGLSRDVVEGICRVAA